MTRYLPILEDPIHASTSDIHAQIRGLMESATSHNPWITVDSQMYTTVMRWAERDDYLTIIEEVIKNRLALKGPPAENALILAQALPPKSIATMVGFLKPLSTPEGDAPPTLLNNIASSLVETGEKLNAETSAKSAKEAEEFKWNAWCEKYGKPADSYDWRGLPSEPVQWGMWGLAWVTPDQWWTAQQEE